MRRTLRAVFLAAASAIALVGAAHGASPTPAAPAAAPAAKPEPTIGGPGAVGDYLRAVHGRLHGRWTQDFIRMVASTYPATHPLNDTSLHATVAMTIRWDGSLAEIVVKETSKSPEFDRIAVDIARKSAPFPLPPMDVVSDDSYAHVEWTFSRDYRACSAGAHSTRVDDPLEISLPRLISRDRIAEALRRVGDAAKSGNGSGEGGGQGDLGMDRFARLYLGRTSPDPVLNANAALALAEAGDRGQVGRLRTALAARPTMETAVRGLQKLGVDVCEALGETLSAGTPPARELGIAAARFAVGQGADFAKCRSPLSLMVMDSRLPTPLRLSALETMLALSPATVRPLITDAMADKDPGVRGAATLASVKKGGGRPEMYRLAPLLHDKAVEIRGAASAGMVRAAGDMALEQLYLLGKETDPRPGTWVAAELAQMSSAASAEFLGKMLKRNNVPVQAAAARALASRKDAAARKELEDVKDDGHMPSDVRAIVAARFAPGGDKPAPAVAVAAAPASVGSGPAGQPVRVLLKDGKNREAAAWIMDKFTSLDPAAGVDVLGAWLTRGTKSAAAGTPAVPAGQTAPGEKPAAAPATTSAFAL